MHDFLKKPERQHVREIPLAPILDLLTVVIFFLILSASFVEVRQNTLPPSSTVVAKADGDDKTIPLNPKLIMATQDKETVLLLKWFGATPGQLVRKIQIGTKTYNSELKKGAWEIVKEFKKSYPAQSQIQLGWFSDMKYQLVLNIVDGVMMEIRDLVFLSPDESEILFKKSL